MGYILVDTAHLEQRCRVWYAVLDTPLPIRRLGVKARFRENLKTRDHRAALRLRSAAVARLRDKLAAETAARQPKPEDVARQHIAHALERLDGAIAELPAAPAATAADPALVDCLAPLLKATAVRLISGAADPAKRAPTFREAAAEYVKTKLPEWRNGDRWTPELARYVLPHIGDKPVSAIGTEDVLAVLRYGDFWDQHNYLGKVARGRIESILEYARLKGWRAEAPNPARWKGHLEHALAKPAKIQQRREESDPESLHYTAMPWRQVPDVMQSLSGMGADPCALALRMTCLTGGRGKQARLATWREIDLAAGVWTLAGARMKAGKLHKVPLSRQALDVLELAKGGRDVQPDEYVFSTTGGRTALTRSAIGYCWRKLALPGTMHGLRGTFRAWAKDHGLNRETAEECLAHEVGNATERAYTFTADTLPLRRAMLDTWGDHCVSAVQ